MTALDLIVLVVVALSALVALSRGFVREVLTLAAWIGAFVTAFYVFEPVRPLVLQVVRQDLLTDLATAALVFIVPLIAFKILGGMIARAVADGPLGSLDKLAGLGFGALRGALLVSAAWLLAGMFLQPERYPPWVQEATLLPQIKTASGWLRGFLPDDFESRARDAAVEVPLKAEAVRDAAGLGTEGGGETGYSAEQLQQMNRLFRSGQ
ncbi:CvpA family protein [Geminicoccaceae bacterium 1502E]|uniref:CvpA family protein n=1 Tax=Marinimicrococcus flavescens TaxID=3031815 RepID=A0AAP3XS86_9PROT|nr:CvpA family protein [Marinimicrococcus flavescens]MDX6751388.1 CvpA family protein [Geminicoccaceae bacterium 1502E]